MFSFLNNRKVVSKMILQIKDETGKVVFAIETILNKQLKSEKKKQTAVGQESMLKGQESTEQAKASLLADVSSDLDGMRNAYHNMRLEMDKSHRELGIPQLKLYDVWYHPYLERYFHVRAIWSNQRAVVADGSSGREAVSKPSARVEPFSFFCGCQKVN